MRLGERRLGGLVAGQVVLLADELVVVEHVELLAGAQLLPADEAREAVQVEHFVSRFAHQVRGADALTATAALRTVTPTNKHNTVRILNFKQASGILNL